MLYILLFYILSIFIYWVTITQALRINARRIAEKKTYEPLFSKKDKAFFLRFAFLPFFNAFAGICFMIGEAVADVKMSELFDNIFTFNFKK
jgi:hypothetical protein